MTGLILILAAATHVDTVVLKEGGFIKDCRVMGDDPLFPGKLIVRTPGGRMGVPKEAVARVDRAKSLFDTFDEKRARLKEQDAFAVFELARWCQGFPGLREEMLLLLQKTVTLRPEHPDARRLLGYARVGSEWRLLPPLALRLRVEGKPELEADLRRQLTMILSMRKDLEVVRELPGGETEPRGVELVLSVTVGQTRTAIFYGQEILGPATHATVTFKPQAKWLTGKPPTLTLRGEVRATAPEAPRQALLDGFSRMPREAHEFFDKLLQERLKKVEAPPTAGKASQPTS